MPFIALNSMTGERVDITQIARPRIDLRAAEMICPVCEVGMIVKDGTIKRAHFAHKPVGNDCPYAEYSAGETPEHREAKMIIRDHVSEWFAEYGMAEGQLEVYIPEVKHARNRIADVLFTFPSGWRVAHEIQLASISVKELEERTDDYAFAGIDVFWWFGRDAYKQGAYRWTEASFGYRLTIDIDDVSPPDETVLYRSGDDESADRQGALLADRVPFGGAENRGNGIR
jgi:competence protein CoiA